VPGGFPLDAMKPFLIVILSIAQGTGLSVTHTAVLQLFCSGRLPVSPALDLSSWLHQQLYLEILSCARCSFFLAHLIFDSMLYVTSLAVLDTLLSDVDNFLFKFFFSFWRVEIVFRLAVNSCLLSITLDLASRSSVDKSIDTSSKGSVEVHVAEDVDEDADVDEDVDGRDAVCMGLTNVSFKNKLNFTPCFPLRPLHNRDSLAINALELSSPMGTLYILDMMELICSLIYAIPKRSQL
jgi:hypothetical protein